MNRRGFLGSVLALSTAPAIVRADNLMKIVVPKPDKYSLDFLLYGLKNDEMMVHSMWLKQPDGSWANHLHYFIPKDGAYKLSIPLPSKETKVWEHSLRRIAGSSIDWQPQMLMTISNGGCLVHDPSDTPINRPVSFIGHS